MIGVTMIDGVLRIQGEYRVPLADRVTWSGARVAKLAELVDQYVEAANFADRQAEEIRHAENRGTQARTASNGRFV